MTLRFKEDTNMNEPIISEILQDMLPVLDNSQLAKLKGVLEHKLWNAEIVYKTVEDSFDKSKLAIYKIKKHVLGRRLAT